MHRLMIKDVMTTFPHSVGHDQSVRAAQQLMQRYAVRHLPVKNAGKLVGILSDRDVELALRMESESGTNLLVSDVSTTDVLTVLPTETVASVTNALSSRKIGCAVIVDSQTQVAGIFTTTDACKLLSELLTGSSTVARQLEAVTSR